MNLKRLNHYFNKSLSSVSSSTPSLIISGRASVHSVLVNFRGRESSAGGDADASLTRAYLLCKSSSLSDVGFKFCPVPTYMILAPISPMYLNVGGNGILFEDGVYLAKSDLANNGDAAADYILSICIFYTGGANT